MFADDVKLYNVIRSCHDYVNLLQYYRDKVITAFIRINSCCSIALDAANG